VTSCVDVRAGETVLIDCEPAHRDLAVAVAESAYRHGARVVDVAYVDRRLQRARIAEAPGDALGVVPEWQTVRLRAAMREDVAIVRIVGDELPGVLAGLDTARAAADFQTRSRTMRWFMKAVITGRVRWTIVAWPTPAWARTVYPELRQADAMRRLAEDLVWFCRLSADDGADGWARHAKRLGRRAAGLTKRRFDRLEFRGPGTHLDVALAPNGRWLGGGERTTGGRAIFPNFPTEEVFTSPDPRGTTGTFRCTTPLSFSGRVIEGIGGEFRNGRLRRIDAGTPADAELLWATFATDRGAGRLGEVALVDRESRIGRAGRVYGETLLDENAAAHIAFGDGFGAARDGEGGPGVNRSAVHVDVMIGSDDVEVTGVSRRGRRTPLIVGGEWQLPD
jgi:aminopeptidase